MRITLDSTILVRAHQRGQGPARALLLEILGRGHTLVLSASILEEVDRVLRYPRLVKRFGLTEDDVAGFVGFLSLAAEMTQPDVSLSAPIRDPNDAHVLQAAMAGSADYLCTLDEHFRETATVQYCEERGVRVISDIELLRIVRGV